MVGGVLWATAAANAEIGGGGNSKLRLQLLTISSPNIDPKVSTVCKGGGRNELFLLLLLLLVLVISVLLLRLFKLLLLLGVEDGRFRMDVVAGDVLLLEFIPLLLVVRTNGVVRDVGVPVKYHFQYYYRYVCVCVSHIGRNNKTDKKLKKQKHDVYIYEREWMYE